jgi:DNA-directed RNA polymerase subunit RPC12/RpoP
MERKYGHKGYQESSRDDRDRPRKQGPPPRPLTPEEKAQQRSLRHAVQREANEVLRCPNCGRNVLASGAIAPETACPHCNSPLHACRACQHFDSSARWECRAEIAVPVTEKSKANTCTLFAARLVLDTTGKRTGTSGGASNDPKSQFDSLFKR